MKIYILAILALVSLSAATTDPKDKQGRPIKYRKYNKITLARQKATAPSKPFAQFIFDTVYPYWLNYASGSSRTRLLSRQVNAVAYDTYANWTSDGWLMYLHGYAYRQPEFSVDRIDTLADLLMTPVGLPVRSLTPSQLASIRNSTGDNFVIPAENTQVTPVIQFPNLPPLVASNKISTDRHGDFSAHLHLPETAPARWGNHTANIQAVSWNIQNTKLNPHINREPTVYLVPHRGLTFISDVDDILRVARVWRPSFAVMTLLAWEFTPWMNMPDIYKSFAQRFPDAHFHYITICPELFTPLYVNFLERFYPRGSIDMRPMSGLVHPRANSHRLFLQTYPNRKVVLVGDTSNPDLVELYPQLVREFPNQIQCVLLRNTSATDASDFTIPDLREFESMDPERYMFFQVPDDLAGINFAAGGCRNASESGPRVLTEDDFHQRTPSVSTLIHWAKKKLGCFWNGDSSDEFCQTIRTGRPNEEAWLHG